MVNTTNNILLYSILYIAILNLVNTVQYLVFSIFIQYIMKLYIRYSFRKNNFF